MAGKLLAGLLALLIANPVCCCTLGHLAGPDQEPSAPHCCAAKEARQNLPGPHRDEEPNDCPCDKERSALLESKAKLAEPHFDAEGPLAQPQSMETTCLPSAERGANALVLSLPPPPPGWRLYCRYLL